MKFSDLDFKPHTIMKGIQARCFFDNGYGVSVVRFPGSYGYDENLYEVAVLKGRPGAWELCYDTPVANDVMGGISKEEIDSILKEVQKLQADQKPANQASREDLQQDRMANA